MENDNTVDLILAYIAGAITAVGLTWLSALGEPDISDAYAAGREVGLKMCFDSPATTETIRAAK